MSETTIGKLLLKQHVPDHLKDHVLNTPLDKKGISSLFHKLSDSPSDTYKDSVTRLSRLGFEVATRQGSTVPTQDLSPLDDKEERFDALEKELSEIKHGTGTKKEKELKAVQTYDKFTKDLDAALMQAGTQKNHTLAKVIISGSRGSAQQYRNTVGAVILVNDEKGRPIIDFPIRHSFAEGLSVPEYLLHSYGTRIGAIDTKLSVADSGFVSKQFARAAMPLKIEMHDCGTDNGIPVPTSNSDHIGSYLAHPVLGFKKNNEVTPGMLATLKSKNVDEIIVRSPITCLASRDHHFGAICQLCAGRREKGTFPQIGEYVGITAVAPLGESLSQGTLNAKHTSSGANLGKTTATGFKLVSQLVNIPHSFQDRAPVAEMDGHISGVRKLPQGGHEVTVSNGNEKPIGHYVAPGFNPYVKEGDRVEAGDVLSEGLINPSDIVKHKGVGEGRRYYADTLYNAFKDSGMGVNHRNFQVLAKAAVDHVRITHPEGLGNHLPDSIVSYQSVEKDYKPRTDSKLIRPDLARGMFLEVPVLHYTIGTRISSQVIDNLKKHKIASITVNTHPPDFEPTMVRLLDTPAHVEDWGHQLYSTYLEKRLIKGVNEGLTSSLKGPSPILGLAYGVGFGDKYKLGEEDDDSEEDKENIETF
jgi:DNA-directed RNA polymerase subunit beta'